MVRVIAVETSTVRASVALTEEDRGLVFRREFEARARLSRNLWPALTALEAEAWPLREADLVAVAGGPGSFTGIRVGLAAAKGLAFVTGVPVVAVSSLAAVAAQAGTEGSVVAVLDARGGLYYYAAYRVAPAGVEELLPPALGTTAEIAALPYDTYAGPGAAPAAWPDASAKTWLERWPDAVALARLGANTFRERGGDDLLTLRPTYLKGGQV
ncbi:MAG: tRNA (adenosine(37)-N6)-threonylcarbamoyltransferase complex dimerization subunit type 1 TsaB [Candidatus Coatesbacteria bacterium]|nr:MAG: tRNA (adenosine(37)-N6)-threonylcarbamoyltransferase complex dimerization subunit type 1 TsaB [Candidatus Coatesbacteria bacterium]